MTDKTDPYLELRDALRNAKIGFRRAAEAFAKTAEEHRRFREDCERLDQRVQLFVQPSGAAARVQQLCKEAEELKRRFDAHLTSAKLSEHPLRIVQELAKMHLAGEELLEKLACIGKEVPREQSIVDKAALVIHDLNRFVEKAIEQINERAPDIPVDIEQDVDAELNRILKH